MKSQSAAAIKTIARDLHSDQAKALAHCLMDQLAGPIRQSTELLVDAVASLVDSGRINDEQMLGQFLLVSSTFCIFLNWLIDLDELRTILSRHFRRELHRGRRFHHV